MIRQLSCSNLFQIILTSLVWNFTETLSAGKSKLTSFVAGNEAANIAEGKAFVDEQSMREMKQVACDPEVSWAHSGWPLGLVMIF